jgi:hypothetical protein
MSGRGIDVSISEEEQVQDEETNRLPSLTILPETALRFGNLD